MKKLRILLIFLIAAIGIINFSPNGSLGSAMKYDLFEIIDKELTGDYKYVMYTKDVSRLALRTMGKLDEDHYIFIPENTIVYVYTENDILSDGENFHKVKIQNDDNFYYIVSSSLSKHPVPDKDYSKFYFNEKYNDKIYIDGIYLKHYLEENLVPYVNMLPQNIFEKYQGTIMFTKRNITKSAYSSKNGESVIGSYIVDGKEKYNIYINEPETLLHEFGHYIYYNWTDNLNEFKSVYKTEAKNSGLDKYYTKTIEEYFAEAYSRVLQKDEKFINQNPLTAVYMKQLNRTLENVV